MTPLPPSWEVLSAALAGRYAIERELGRGGMATVYLAQDLKLHRHVALKVVRPELATSLGNERFLREIEIAARLSDPHILPLHDSGEAGGSLYYACRTWRANQSQHWNDPYPSGLLQPVARADTRALCPGQTGG